MRKKINSQKYIRYHIRILLSFVFYFSANNLDGAFINLRTVKISRKTQAFKINRIFFWKIGVELRNCPWVGQLKLAASVRERPPTTASLTRSRNSYAVSSKILRTNESNLRNYLFNKIFVRNFTYYIFLYLVSNKKKTYAKSSKMLEIPVFNNN